MKLNDEQVARINELKKVAQANAWPFARFKIVYMLCLCFKREHIDRELQFFLDEAKKKTDLNLIDDMITDHLNAEED